MDGAHTAAAFAAHLCIKAAAAYVGDPARLIGIQYQDTSVFIDSIDSCTPSPVQSEPTEGDNGGSDDGDISADFELA